MIAILGYGFLGKSLAAAFRKNNITFKAGTRNIQELHVEDAVYFDLNNPGTYSDFFSGVDTIIHLIHPTVPVTSEYNSDIDLNYNIRSNKLLLDHLKTTNVQRIILVSTGGAIYGPQVYSPADEKHPVHPISNYGKGKLKLEELYRNACEGIQLNIIRPTNVYGLHQATAQPQGVIAHILKAARSNATFYQWGEGGRKDYLYEADFVSAILKLLEKKALQTVYNLSSGYTYSISEIIATAESLLQKKISVKMINELPVDVKNVTLDSSAFASEFSWHAEYDLQSGLLEMLNKQK